MSPREKKWQKNHISKCCFLITVKPALVSLAPKLLARVISQVCCQPKKTEFSAVQLISLVNWTSNKSRNLLTCSGLDTIALQMWQVPSPDPDGETGNIISLRIGNKQLQKKITGSWQKLYLLKRSSKETMRSRVDITVRTLNILQCGPTLGHFLLSTTAVLSPLGLKLKSVEKHWFLHF